MDKLIFLNIGWMSRYEGARGDQISGGFKHVSRHGYGHELFNFKPYRGRVYGTAPVPHGTIKLEKLGAPKNADVIHGVTVIWVARSRIVGWYKNATVYRHSQPPPKGGHSYRGAAIRYRATAAASDAKLIRPPDARLFPIPRAGERKHAMGRYSWFAEGPTNREFRAKVLKYVATNGDISVLGGKRVSKISQPRQSDPQKRTRIEKAAITHVTKYFQSQGYDVSSCERDNFGWDLNATHSEMNTALKLEVKGLSGSNVVVELTPNEYKMMRKHKGSYRICVVTSCLNKKELAIFGHNAQMWIDGDDRPLQIKEMTAARLYLSSQNI